MLEIKIDEQLIKIETERLKNVMKDRIWDQLVTEDGRKVPTDLIDTGLLNFRYDFEPNYIRLQYYYVYLEAWYGQIFAFDDFEFDFLSELIIDAIDKQWSFRI